MGDGIQMDVNILNNVSNFKDDSENFDYIRCLLSFYLLVYLTIITATFPCALAYLVF